MTTFLYSYRYASSGARELSRALPARRIRHNNSRFRGHPRKAVINWGASHVPQEVTRSSILNSPRRVGYVTDKLKFFRLAAPHCRMPEYTDDPQVVRRWIDDGHLVVARTLLTGSAGRGIILVKNRDNIPPAPLYTKYISKMSEFRIHLVGGEIVDAQRKAKRNDVPREQVNWKVRTHDNGFIFARDNLVVPADCREQSRRAFLATGLDFGAVDVIWNQKRKEAYVLEINTAPGLEGQTVRNYAEALNRHIPTLF